MGPLYRRRSQRANRSGWVHNPGGGTLSHDQTMNASLAFFLGPGVGRRLPDVQSQSSLCTGLRDPFTSEPFGMQP